MDAIFFGKVSSSSHNAARSNQLAFEMKKLGLFNDSSDQKLLHEQFKSVVNQKNNIINEFSNSHGNFEVRESSLFGPSGKATTVFFADANLNSSNDMTMIRCTPWQSGFMNSKLLHYDYLNLCAASP